MTSKSSLVGRYFHYIIFYQQKQKQLDHLKLGHVAQSQTCMATDASLAADPGVASSTPAQSHTFVEIDYYLISMVILPPSTESFKKDCCQLQANVCAQSTG